ncbi:Rgp1-domain-containing protein [Testicularia cyperi]|uniref:Rgp1-domain-containing protein n=1 Tax=Testicularia cyperi TaxID=1882483 RepID=A0A317XIT0_9BASI|nr:Rgp1-domain-containing protein [Testicularia cyperi]
MADHASLHHSSLKVSIRPIQSSFFAGEDFACSITFTNTNIPVAHSQPIPQHEFTSNRTFDSDAHVLDTAGSSSAPAHHDVFRNHPPARRVVSALPSHAKSRSVDVRTLARLNTSDSETASQPAASSSIQPGRAKSFMRQLSGELLPERKRLIGKDAPAPTKSMAPFIHPWSIQQRQQNAAATPPRHAKSASMSLNNSHNTPTLGLGRPSSSSTSTPNGDYESPFSKRNTPEPSENGLDSTYPSPTPPSRVSSLTMPFGAKRVPSGPISANHPHSRKKSVAQIQAEDLTEAFELDGSDARGVSPMTPSTPTTPGAGPGLGSLHSAGLGQPGASSSSSSDFYKLGRNDTMESVFRESINDWSQSAPRSDTGTSPIFPNNDTLPPGSEKVLWSFVQIGGTAEIDESLIKPGDFENLRKRLAYGDVIGASPVPGSAGGTPRLVGGGDLGHDDGQDASSRSGWSSYLRGPFGGLGSRSLRHRRTGSTLQDAQERTLQSRAVPTFATPPSILAVDLTLAPGESKSYSFRIKIPLDLPPSYIGKAIKLVYNLTLGTNRLHIDGRNSSKTQKSRLIQIPVRIYNHVGASGYRPFFDLMNPVILTKEEAVVVAQEDGGSLHVGLASESHGKEKTQSKEPVHGRRVDRTDLERYAAQLLDQAAQGQDPGSDASSQRDAVVVTPAMFKTSEQHGQGSCKAAVETLARTSTKVSYDISKDGKVAAVLTLVRSKYRLGDTIMGVISINEKGSLARIARVAATLETFEEIQPSISTLPAGRMQRATRRIHAEHHESALDKGRANFTLPIPSGASPEFVTSGVKLNWLVRLSFLTVASTKAPVTQAAAAEPATETAKPAAVPSRLPPPPHLVPSPSDGFGRYHISLSAVPSLAGTATALESRASRKMLDKLGFAAETRLETVECAVPVTILPNSTGFKVGNAEFFA